MFSCHDAHLLVEVWIFPSTSTRARGVPATLVFVSYRNCLYFNDAALTSANRKVSRFLGLRSQAGVISNIALDFQLVAKEYYLIRLRLI
jgi:hypothetical protein